jgi:hypothetical protein
MNTVKDSTNLSLGLVEHDVNGDDFCVWMYPSLSAVLQNVIISRISTEGQLSPYIYFKYKNDWVYALTMPVSKEIVTDVLSASIVIVSKSFNPEKFNSLAVILFEQYSSTGDPTKILEGYLSVHTSGNFSNKAGTFDVSLFKDDDALLNVSCLKELATSLGVEFTVLWNAVLLKKRILVVDENPEKLLNVVRSLPQLAWHRKDYSILRPIVRDEPEHLEDLKSSGVFIAGTLDGSLASQSDLYDVLLSFPEPRVTVTTHAVAEMKMCSVHRELAALCEEHCETDLDLLKILAKKTHSLVSNLKNMMPAGEKLTEDLINEKVSNVAAQQWLVRLATAENLM